VIKKNTSREKKRKNEDLLGSERIIEINGRNYVTSEKNWKVAQNRQELATRGYLGGKGGCENEPGRRAEM